MPFSSSFSSRATGGNDIYFLKQSLSLDLNILVSVSAALRLALSFAFASAAFAALLLLLLSSSPEVAEGCHFTNIDVVNFTGQPG